MNSMTTSLLQSGASTLIDRDKKSIRRDASVPRHVAVSLQGTVRHTQQRATAALQAIVDGCAERGVEILTLVRPQADVDFFDKAVREITQPRISLNICAESDGREELVNAIRKLAAKVERGELDPNGIDAARMESELSTNGLPPVDLLIATGSGEKLCGSLLWQS